MRVPRAKLRRFALTYNSTWRYLHSGKNILILGGQPFDVPVASEGGKYHSARPQDTYARSLDFRHMYEVPVPKDAQFAWRPGYELGQARGWLGVWVLFYCLDLAEVPALNGSWPLLSCAPPPSIQLRHVTVLVKDQDEALRWYTETLGLKKVEDRPFGPGSRWLVVAGKDQQSPGIVLELASDAAKTARMGKETNWVFRVSDCSAFYDALRAKGVHFRQAATRQPWGTVQAIFEDPYGNIFVAESTNTAAPSSSGVKSSATSISK